MNFLRSIMLAVAGMALIQVSAQNSTDSPYSRFGYGILTDHANSSQKGMGGVGYAMNNGRQINNMNPASYASIDTLTFLFDMGVDLRLNRSIQGDEKGNDLTAGLTYVDMQFPLGRYMGGSVGLLPYSQTGYSFGDEVVNGEAKYQGSGGINEIYFGLSGRPFKGFSIGANASYLFGTLLNDTYMTADNGASSLFETVLTVRDFDFRFGAQYSFRVGRLHRFTLGAVYSPGKEWHGKTYGVKYDITNDTKPDTIGYQRLNGSFSRPATYGGGINYVWNDRLMVEADFTYQPWKDAKFARIEGFPASKFDDRWKAALGVQYTPDPRGSYLKRINYRLGGYYNRDYIMVGDNNVNDVGVTLGFGLPAPVNRLTKTVVNIGLEYRHRQASPVALVKENYFQITLGINFNELWFWQNKIQ